MIRVAMTGANGFLGWHTRVALFESGVHVDTVPVGEHFSLSQATAAVSGADQLIHIAGVNRGTDEEVRKGNTEFAAQITQAIRLAEKPPKVLTYASSIQITDGSLYGESKLRAGEILGELASDLGLTFRNVVLPNLFGEHGKPFYNAVTSTFCHLLINGESPVIENDKELTLLHAQDAADLLIGTIPTIKQTELEVCETVSGLSHRLITISKLYAKGEIPNIAEKFDRDLFNTYRSFLLKEWRIMPHERHADSRGSFFEVVRSHGGPGQSSFSTTKSGISRGDHFHRRKVERFTVLSGQGKISMRRLFTSDVQEFHVNGENPVAIDMPTGWAHKITNTSDEVLYTSFWTNDIFDPNNPDTISEKV